MEKKCVQTMVMSERGHYFWRQVLSLGDDRRP
jgi:hypothetical protein